MARRAEPLNLSFLLDHEREMILSVLQKDEKVRKREEKRIRKLKNELLEIKRRGRRSDAEERECAVCLRALGLVIERGRVCEQCSHRVCSFCMATPPGSKLTRCTVCAKISELKVATGEWFVEERSKRYSHSSSPGSDIIKESIMASPPDGGSSQMRSSGQLQATATSPLPPRPPSGQSECSVGRSSQGKAKRKGSSVLAVESSGLPAVPNNQRGSTVQTHTHLESRRRVRPDGAESVCSLRSTDSITEKLAGGRSPTGSATPSIAVSKTSLTSDRSRSELDLTASGVGPNDDALSGRCRSVPGINEADSDEDIDALMSAHYKSTRSMSSAQSVSSTPCSERKTYLNLPDSDADTTSLSSMMSVYSEAGDYGSVCVSGEIRLSVSYSYKTGALTVLVRECRSLATADERRHRTDSYVKTYLLPDKSRQSKRKTSVKANTINPVFNENLRYVLSHSQLETRTLQVSVWHHDRFAPNSFLGEVEIPLDTSQLETPLEEWFSLQPRADSSPESLLQYKGELTVVLKYIPAEKNLSLPLDQVQVVKKGFLKGKRKITLPEGGRVELLVKEAKNLTAVKGGSSDPFVKGYLLPDERKSTKHKTSVAHGTVNPRWNHTFTYCGLQPSDLESVCLELTLWDKEPLSSNVFLGGVRLGAGTGWAEAKESAPRLLVKVMGQDAEALLDSGSVITLVRPELVEEPNVEPVVVACIHGDTKSYSTSQILEHPSAILGCETKKGLKSCETSDRPCMGRTLTTGFPVQS
ncbi:synaptotagmin-like protein 5 [Engraulis encrasicolus]|uniref:synaptotagmin-like protein 5 n=1 Tax=Engraulis encrasicolus TaxID=184585 RepID=UPI002FD5D467